MFIRAVMLAGLVFSFGACGKSQDVKSLCEDNFAHGEKDGTWIPGKGDKAKFMEYCVQQTPEIVKCSSMESAFDKDCEKVTGIEAKDPQAFSISMKLAALRAGR